MTGARRLSQAISEGDAISIVVHVADAAAARAAEEQGAEALAHDGPVEHLRDASALPILARAGRPEDAAAADAWVLVAENLEDDDPTLEQLYEAARELGLECVVDVADEDELAAVLDRIDPEIFLLTARGAEDELECVLGLLHDVPAGKLAIAELRGGTVDDLATLERAGVDAVLLPPGNVADLVGGEPPEV